MRALLRDFACGLRLLRRTPGFAFLTVLILALGIGASTAIFSLVHAVFLKSLPYRDPGTLTVIWSDFSKSGGNRRAITAPADFSDWKTRSRSFSAIAAYSNGNRTFTALDQPITPLAHLTTANYFDVLGVQAFRGRTFLPGEDAPGAPRVALISYALWRSAFAGSDAVIGSSIELDGEKAQLIGVLPPSFRVPNSVFSTLPDLWIPASFDMQREDRRSRSLTVFGRLNPSVKLEAARAEMSTIAAQIAKETPQRTDAPDVYVTSIKDDFTAEFKQTFLLLLGAVGMILLIACANVANLLLGRFASRGRELAMRAALGASRAAILRQVLAESLTLSIAGGVCGVFIAAITVRPLLHLVPDSAGLPFTEQVGLNLPVLGFALLLSIVTSVLFGMAPARQALQTDVIEVLKDGGRSRMAGRSGKAWRSVLIAAEMSLSLLLLAGCVLMIETFWKLSKLDSGFDASHVLTVRNSIRGESYATPAARRSHFELAAEKLAKIDGVESVSAVSFLVPLAQFAPTPFERVSHPAEPGQVLGATTLTVLPRYFETMRIPILAGRAIDASDGPDAAKTVVISSSLARRYFSDGNPIGESIRMSDRPGQWRIVGVCGDVRGVGVHPEPFPLMYFSQAQGPFPVMSFVMRTRGDPARLGSIAERTLWSTGRMMNVYFLQPLEQRVAETYWQSRFTMVLLSVFAGLALVLASVGIYGVISFLTQQRTQEIGIRMALGASPGDVLRDVLQQGLALAATGLGCGIVLSLFFGKFLESSLYGVRAGDPWALGAVCAILLFIAMLATMAPAMRAARIDPVRALSTE